MTLLSRQVMGLLLAAAGLVLATSASVMLVQPILAPQSVPDTQAAPDAVQPGQLPPPDTRTDDRPGVADHPPQPPRQAEVPDDAQVPDDVPVTSSDIPPGPTGIPPTAQEDPGIVETPDIPSVTPVVADDSDVVVADDSDVVIADDTPPGDTPVDAVPHQGRPSAPDPRATNGRAGQADVAAQPGHGKPTFPAGWPWHERLGNQGNGKGHGPPSRSG